MGSSKIVHSIGPQGYTPQQEPKVNKPPIYQSPVRIPTPRKDPPPPSTEKNDYVRYGALPGLNLINVAVNTLKESIHKETKGFSCRKACAYLGFRIISYSCLPLVCNLISLFVSVLLVMIGFILAASDDTLYKWSWTHLKGSVRCLKESLWDLTCDVRQIMGICCNNPTYTKI